MRGGTQLRTEVYDHVYALSQLIACEAVGESRGGKRAVGWTVGTHVFRAYSVPTLCGGYSSDVWAAAPPDASLPDKYISIMTADDQFTATSNLGTTAETDHAAVQIYFGAAPDPVSCWCPNGQKSGTDCGGHCSALSFYEAHPSGPPWFLPRTGSCSGSGPAGSSCEMTPPEKTCGNGSSDNCFWRIKN